MARVFSTTGVTSRGPTLDDANFNLSYTVTTELTGGSSGNATIDDRDVVIVTGGSALIEGIVIPQELTFDAFSRAGLTITNLTPSIATISISGNEATLSRVSDGTARILYQTPWLAREINVPILSSGSASGVEFLSYTSGSLARHISDSLDTLIASGQDQEVFTSGGSRNTDVWTQADMSSHQIFNSTTGGPQGVLISALHTLSPHHYTAPIGATVAFIGNNDVVYTRTISNSMQIGTTDLRLNLLSSALPAAVVPAKTLPVDYMDYLPSIDIIENYRSTYTIPGFYINKFNEAYAIECGIANNSIYLYQSSDAFPDRRDMYTIPIGGDSGSPVYLIINDELVVLTTLYTPGSGPSIVNNHAAINSAMTTLGGGYQLLDIDLSGFTSF